jgi:hypothetical protein
MLAGHVCESKVDLSFEAPIDTIEWHVPPNIVRSTRIFISAMPL